jgi:hypothetical protein
VTIDGDIIDFEHSALMDLCYQDPAVHHPCTLVREQADEIKSSLTKAFSFLQNRPDLIFSFMMLQRLASTFKEAIGMELIPTQDSTVFFRKFEWLVFSRKAWKKAEFQDGVEKDLALIRRKHGPFDLG